jgi:predicted O-methyltransferase YrrM
MRGFPQRWWRRAKKANQSESFPMPFYGVWGAVARLSAEIETSDFMAEMVRRRDAFGSQGLMGVLDCAILYALTRWHRPAVVVESGGFVGMSSAFILKALMDEGLTQATLYSIEWSEDCNQGALIPDELRPQYMPLHGKVEDFVRGDELPSSIDMFLHDSSHRYRHMLWEFREFWPRLRDGGLLVSHDVHLSAAFAEFVANTYAHDKKTGLLDLQRTSHYEWGRWGYIGFAIKKAANSNR